MWALRTFWWVRKGSTTIRDEVAKIPEAINPQKWVWSKKGVVTKKKIGDKCSFVPKGLKYHIPLRKRFAQTTPTDWKYRPTHP